MTPPPFARSIRVSMRFEWYRLMHNWGSRLFVVMVVALGAVAGIRGNESLDPVFGPVELSMLLTVASALWCALATLANSHPAFREVLVARCADEWAFHLARVAATGLYGGLLSAAFFLAFNLFHMPVLSLWPYLIKWLPHVALGHMLGAAIGGLAGLVFRRSQALAVLASVVLWVLAQLLMAAVGPSSPDMLLRVLSWNSLYKDGAAEPVYMLLLIGLAAVTGLLVVLGMVLFLVTGRRELAPPAPKRVSRVIWGLAVGVLAVSWITCWLSWNGREGALWYRTSDAGQRTLTVAWDPRGLRIDLRQGAKTLRSLSGPVRPTALNWTAGMLNPYIGRHGVLLPVERLVGAGPYDLRVTQGVDWAVYGCSAREPLPGGDVVCRGDAAERDWLILLPRKAVDEQLAMVAYSPRAEAQSLFRGLTQAAFRQLERPVPDVLFLGDQDVRWLGAETLQGPGLFGAGTLGKRRMAVYEAALAVATYKAGLRDPWPDMKWVSFGGQASRTPMPLVATIDRLMFEFGQVYVNTAERDLRAGRSPNIVMLNDWALPRADRDIYNRWWTAVDDLIVNRHVAPAEIWAALSQLDPSAGGLDWPPKAEALWNVRIEGS